MRLKTVKQTIQGRKMGEYNKEIKARNENVVRKMREEETGLIARSLVAGKEGRIRGHDILDY